MPPIVTLTTDFGTSDAFVGVMKGVLLGIAPDARLVDLTHDVPPQDVAAAAHLLRGAVPYFPDGTIHVAVVDPGVGTPRRALVVATRRALFVGPDNGVLGLAAPRADVRGIWDVSRSRHRLPAVSRTFHGRDVFAPIAARLACGMEPSALGPRLRTMQRLPPLRVRRVRGRATGEVVWVDRFGNLVTNLTAADVATVAPEPRRRGAFRTHGFRARGVSVTIGDVVLPLLASYADASSGTPLALVNSNDLVEIAVSGGSAADRLGIGRGARVAVGRD